MHDSLYIPCLVCWRSVSDTHRTRTQHSRVPAARVRRHVTSAASGSAYQPTSCVDPHVIHSRISTSPSPQLTPQCRQNGILSWQNGSPSKFRVAKKDPYVVGVKNYKKVLEKENIKQGWRKTCTRWLGCLSWNDRIPGRMSNKCWYSKTTRTSLSHKLYIVCTHKK